MDIGFDRHSVFHKDGPSLTVWQSLSGRNRNYVILFTAFTIYLVVCTLFYAYHEHWEPSVALSFIVDTMTTVGFGYHTPSDDQSRLFTTFAMIVGVLVIFSGISTAMTSRLSYFKTKMSINDLDKAQEMHNDLQHRVTINIVALIVGLFAVTAIFCWMEDWTFITSLYFAVQTATSVGYGDIDLRANGTHIVVGIYEFFSVILLTYGISNLTDLHQERKRLAKMLQIAERKQMLDRIQELDTGNGVGEAEFVLAVLEQLGVLDRDVDIEPWIKKFRQFDVDHSGMLRREAIAEFSAAESSLGAKQAGQIRHLQETPLGSFDLGGTVSSAVSAGVSLLGRVRARSASQTSAEENKVASPLAAAEQV